jgi:RNA polymerase sigma-70 factor (ECF subfamily)
MGPALVAIRRKAFRRRATYGQPIARPCAGWPRRLQYPKPVEPRSSDAETAPAPGSVSMLSAATGASDPERWVEEHGDYLFKYALARLRDPLKAEDMVQETFLAALRGRETFAGRSAEKSWLVGILKHKILDYYRKAGRETAFTDLEFYADEESDRFIPDGLFAGGWIHELGPTEWDDPGASLDKKVFWKTFHDCSDKLPRTIATVFTLREVDGVESKEICALLNISENNLWVMLHRARMALRRCLETNWFGKQA